MPIHDEDIHAYDNTHLRLERPALYLVSLLIADKALQQSYRTGVLPHLASIAEEHKKSEVIRLIIEIATTYRLIAWNAKQKPGHDSVGRVSADESTKIWGNLSMLEACNKVIHAELIAFESRRFPRSYSNFLKPRVHLAGSKGRKEWVAVIDVLPFANAAVKPITDPP